MLSSAIRPTPTPAPLRPAPGEGSVPRRSDESGSGSASASVSNSRSTYSSQEMHRIGKGPIRSASGIGRKPRRCFDPAERRQIGQTRRDKACVRCRFQKIKCEWAGSDDKTEPCLACQRIDPQNVKTIHIQPCMRRKISAAVLHRSGGLGLTSRWHGVELKNVGDRVATEGHRIILVDQGLGIEPITFEVVHFQPRAGDVTARFWIDFSVDGSGVRKFKELACYCLVDVHKAAYSVERYTIINAIPALIRHIQRTSANASDPVRMTQVMALQYYCELPEAYGASQTTAADGEQRKKLFLENLFIFWLAIQHSKGSSYICGDDKLGMTPEKIDLSYPLRGLVSVPRMIVAQFDSINTRILRKYKQLVVADLQWFLFQADQRWWLVAYLGLFMLLREASGMSQDRYRHARDNYGKRIRYSIPDFVEQLHDGCNDLLSYWHYYNWRGWPSPDAMADQSKTQLRHLTPAQYELVRATRMHPDILRQVEGWKLYRESNGTVSPSSLGMFVQPRQYEGPQDKFDWDNDLYWVSQLFEQNWTPHPTYQREAIPRF